MKRDVILQHTSFHITYLGQYEVCLLLVPCFSFTSETPFINWCKVGFIRSLIFSSGRHRHVE